MTIRHGSGRRPPALVRLLVRILVPADEREFFLGDLEESRRRSWPREILGALSLRFTRRSGPGGRPSLRGDGMFSELSADLRYGVRMMVRSPAFTVVALVTMALGIGVNTAMFSIVHGVLLKPLPYPRADRIVYLRANNLSRGWTSFSIAPLNFWDWQTQNHSFEAMAAYQSRGMTYTGGDEPQVLHTYQVTDRFLGILGGEPTLGRGIAAADLEPGAADVVLLSHGFWERTFGGSPSVLGRTMTLDGRPFTVVGVLPARWHSFSSSTLDLVTPLKPQPYWYTARGSHFLRAVARLKPGVSTEQAQADLSGIAAALAARYPDSNKGWGASVQSLQDAVVGSSRAQLLILMASVGLVLLIACANMANMTLARAMVRTRELAIRAAVGAGRGRVVRQLLAESTVLSVAGGALGVLLAYGSVAALVAGWPTLLPRSRNIGIDPAVLVFALGLSVASGVLFGLVPALTVVHPRLAGSLGQGGRSTTGDRSRRWLRAALVAGELSLAVMLLVGTGLLVRSFAALQKENPGFQTHDRLVFTTPLPSARYGDDEAVKQFVDGSLARLQALPGVESATVANMVPLRGSDEIWSVWLAEHAVPGAQEDASALFYRVGPGYFKTMGIPLREGRRITRDDRGDTLRVAVISASLAQQCFPGEDPLGRMIKFGRGDGQPSVEVVGVVGDVQHYDLGRASVPQVYVPFAQRPTRGVSFVVRSSVAPASLVSAVRGAIGAVDPDQPLVGIETGREMMEGAVSLPRFRTLLMSIFGLTALLLATVGLYGVLAYSVSQRTREICVRVALGASRGSVLGLIVREGAPLVGAGLAVGLGGAVALSRILKSMLFGVGTHDLLVFTAVPLVLALVALVAMLIPARRATRVDPVRALQESSP